MPQINEYLPETNSQGAVGGVSPNLEAVSLFGRGVEHVGAALNEASDVIHRRESQEEISQVYGQFAQARADWNVRLKERQKAGNIDPDKFDQEYADYVNKIGEGLNTAEGKNFFNRQANRLGGSLMQKVITDKAQLAGELAFQQITQGVNIHAANVKGHPEDGADALDSTMELIANQADIDPAHKIRLQNQLGTQIAEATIQGWADKDPGKDEQGNPYPNLAKQILDHTDPDGSKAFDKYLSVQQRDALYSYARTADNNRRIEEDRADATAHRQLEKQGFDYMDQNANKVLNGQLSVKDVQTAPLTFQQKEYMINKIRAQSMDESRTDPRRFHKVYSDILHGNITTREQLAAEFDRGGLAPATMDHLEHEIDATPEGHIVKQMQKQLDKSMQELRFKGVGGAYTTAGDTAYTNAQTEIYQARVQAQSQGISDRTFYSNTNAKDPTSPVAILNKYRLNFADRIRAGADEATGQVSSPQNAGAIRYSNSPTKEVPPPEAQAPSQAPAAEPPPTGGPASGQRGGEFDYAAEQLGLTGDAGKKTKSARDAQREKENAILGVRPPQAPQPKEEPNPADDQIRPGESIMAWKKRTGK